MTLRAQDPPCPCDENTCLWTVKYGHLKIFVTHDTFK